MNSPPIILPPNSTLTSKEGPYSLVVKTLSPPAGVTGNESGDSVTGTPSTLTPVIFSVPPAGRTVINEGPGRLDDGVGVGDGLAGGVGNPPPDVPGVGGGVYVGAGV